MNINLDVKSVDEDETGDETGNEAGDEAGESAVPANIFSVLYGPVD